MSDSTVTVGVPVYNGANYLRFALESLVAQSRPPDQIVIYDNASTDISYRIAKSYADKYPHIRTVRRNKNLGAARNFNDLVTDTSSTYFSWLCHDDVWDVDLLEKSFEMLERNPEIGVAFALPNWINTNGEPIGAPSPVIWSDSSQAKTRIQELLADEVHSLLFDCNTVHGLIRRTCLEKTRLIRPFPSGDNPLIFELALHGRMSLVTSTHFNRRQHVESSMLANSDNWARQLFYDPAEKRAPAELLDRVRDYLSSTSRSNLRTRERISIEISVLKWAAGKKRPRRIVGQFLRRRVPRRRCR